MKKILLIAAIALTANFANAQDGTGFGIKAGLDMVSAKADGASVSATGFFVGGFVEFGLADKLTLQPGLNYHTASKDDFKFDYISVPVIFQYEIATAFKVKAGPSMYYSLESEDDDKTRFNLGVGASYDFTENFFVEPRYDIGLTGDLKVSHFLIGVGYRF